MEQDLRVLRHWWTDLSPTAPKGIAALWFGMVDFIVDGQVRRTLYAAGCDRFDPDDATGDWAVGPYAWWPDERYIAPPGLAAMLGPDYRAVLAYAADLVRALRPQDDVNVDAVVVGFDDGDFTVVWTKET